MGVLEAFVEDFLLGGRVAVVLHAQGVDLVGEAVEGAHVLVDDGVAEVPVLGAVGGLVEEGAIADDEAGALFGFKEGDAVGLEVGVEGGGVAGENVDVDDALDGALGVRDLGVGGGDGGQGQSGESGGEEDCISHEEKPPVWICCGGPNGTLAGRRCPIAGPAAQGMRP